MNSTERGPLRATKGGLSVSRRLVRPNLILLAAIVLAAVVLAGLPNPAPSALAKDAAGGDKPIDPKPLDSKPREPSTLERLAQKPIFEEVLSRSFETILPDSQRITYTELDLAGRSTYRRRFWRMNDPTPATARNEFLEQHLHRLAYALGNFDTRGDYLWDDRGDVALRFGVPPSRAKVMGDILLAFGSRGISPSAEVWTYPRMDMTIQFIDPNMDGRYVLGADTKTHSARSRPRSVSDPKHAAVVTPTTPTPVARNIEAEHMTYVLESLAQQGQEALEDVPLSYGYRPPVEPILIFYEIVTAKGEGGLTDIAVNYQIPRNSLSFTAEGEGYVATLDKRVRVLDPDFDVVTEDARSITFRCDSEDATREATLVTDEWRIDAPPGEYVVGISLEDTLTGRAAHGRSRIAVPGYATSRLTMSDIQIASSIGEGSKFRRMDQSVVPHPIRAFEPDHEMIIYFELYGLEPSYTELAEFNVTTDISGHGYEGDKGAIERFFANLFPGKRHSVSSSIDATGSWPDTAFWYELSLKNLEEDNYDLTITVEDLASGQKVTRTATFTVMED